MAYQIKCDDYVLYDPRDEDFNVLNPKVTLEVNTVGGGSFTILSNHPYYDKLQKLKSVFEVIQDGQVIFRGRMTEESKDFQNCLYVDLEGAMAYANDTIIPPFDFADESTFPRGENENVVEIFLRWIIETHNAQAQPFQQFKLGNVTVTDENNYITRSSEEDLTTWECLKTRLFNSSLGGYLIMRYADDGNYIDYVKEFEYTNTQKIVFGENILDIKRSSDGNETYSAILPKGATEETEDGESITLDISSLPDGELDSDSDFVKVGRFIYSKSAVAKYGWICVPPEKTVWEDVTLVNRLKTKAVNYLANIGMMFSNTIEINAVDLRYTDEEIQSLKPFRNVVVDAPKHGISNVTYPLTKLEIDILNPQNNVITVGDTVKSLVGIAGDRDDENDSRFEKVGQLIEGNKSNVNIVSQRVTRFETEFAANCEAIVMNALAVYSETGDFGEFKKTVNSQFTQMAESINMNFSTLQESIQNVDGDLQKSQNELRKYIRFSVDGIEIGKDENSLKLMLDNDMIKFTQNGRTVGWWDGTDFHTGNLVVEVNERAQFGDFAFIPRSDGSLMFLKVGGGN